MVLFTFSVPEFLGVCVVLGSHLGLHTAHTGVPASASLLLECTTTIKKPLSCLYKRIYQVALQNDFKCAPKSRAKIMWIAGRPFHQVGYICSPWVSSFCSFFPLPLSLSMYVFICAWDICVYIRVCGRCELAWLYMLVCVVCMYVYVYVCVACFLCAGACGDQRSTYGVLFSPRILFWRQVFHWAWNSPVYLDWLASEPWGHLLSASRVLGSQCSGTSAPGCDVLLGVHTQFTVLIWHTLYPLSCLQGLTLFLVSIFFLLW